MSNSKRGRPRGPATVGFYRRVTPEQRMLMEVYHDKLMSGATTIVGSGGFGVGGNGKVKTEPVPNSIVLEPEGFELAKLRKEVEFLRKKVKEYEQMYG